VSLQNPNFAFVNASGESGGRRHNLKVSGTYTLPWQITWGGNLTLQSGLPITRTWSINACSATITTNCLRQSVNNINAEPRGSVELPKLMIADMRLGRFFKFGANRLDVSFDLYNLTNANTTYGVRTGTGLTGVREGGLSTNPVVNIPTFLSPNAVLGPRILRFNVTFSFSQK
jgi:hypothetical protein